MPRKVDTYTFQGEVWRGGAAPLGSTCDNPGRVVEPMSLAGLREGLSKFRREGFPPGSPPAYVFALACVAVAAVAHFAFDKFTPGITPSILYNPAVFVAALFGGVRAGLLAVGVSVVLLWWAFDWRSFEAQAPAFSPAVNCTLYVAAAMVIIWVAARYRSSGQLSAHHRQDSGMPTAAESVAGRPFAPPAHAVRRAWNRLVAHPMAGYAGALLCVALASLIRASFAWFGGEMLPLVSYYPAVLLAALMGGTGAGLLAISLSLCVVWSDFPGPLLSFERPTRDASVSLSLYVFASLLTVWLAEDRRLGTDSARAKQSSMLEWVTSVVVAATAVLLTTLVLLAIDSHLAPEHLILGYLLPTIIIAMHYGSTVAVFTSFISGLAAAYFLFLPKFSFYIADPHNLAELAFFFLLAVTASKAVALPAGEARGRKTESL
jgi:K+-sensing histidine kinase KdpD